MGFGLGSLPSSVTVIKAALLIPTSWGYSWLAVSNTIPKILRVGEGEKVTVSR